MVKNKEETKKDYLTPTKWLILGLFIGFLLLSHIFIYLIGQTTVKIEDLDKVCTNIYGDEFKFISTGIGTEPNITCAKIIYTEDIKSIT